MNRNLAKCLLVVALLLPTVAQAMTIVQFDKLSKGEKGASIADLVEVAERSLIEVGRPDDSGQVNKLFTTNAPDGEFSIGLEQFYMTLAIARVADATRVTIEKVLADCLEKNDSIKLPDSFYTMASKLQYPPQHK